jgi:arylsulfatase A-like enzyme
MIKLLICFVFITVAQAGNNVLLIITDDFGTDSQSLYNNTPGATAPTPNINSLAASGVRFTQGYAYPVCSPTRASILTGRLGFRTGVGDVVNASSALTAAELTLPEVIGQNSGLGIQAGMFGKWHLSDGTPAAVRNLPNTIGGWPHYAGSTAGALMSYSSWLKTTNGSNATVTTYPTTDLVNDAVTWITARNTANQPWIAWLAFNAPHAPFHIPPTALHSYGSNPATNLLKYRAAIEAMDTEIGRLLQAVNPATTDIIFIGDNGTPGQVIQAPYNSAHAKDSLYEGGTRVPFIIKGPSVSAGGRTDASLVHVVDLFSTILEMAGVPLPTSATLDSRSLMPILAQQAMSDRGRLYLEKFDVTAPTGGGRALRDGRYKLIRLNNGNDEFYDLTSDPSEVSNLIAGGINSLSPAQLSYYYRLRFNLGDYQPTEAFPPLSHSISTSGFSLTAPVASTGVQTLWQSTDLDFWSPVAGAGMFSSGGNITLTAPPAVEDKIFYSILTEND